jgi:hypothetical protein
VIRSEARKLANERADTHGFDVRLIQKQSQQINVVSSTIRRQLDVGRNLKKRAKIECRSHRLLIAYFGLCCASVGDGSWLAATIPWQAMSSLGRVCCWAFD